MTLDALQGILPNNANQFLGPAALGSVGAFKNPTCKSRGNKSTPLLDRRSAAAR
jgi:hypothetical protein